MRLHRSAPASSMPCDFSITVGHWISILLMMCVRRADIGNVAYILVRATFHLVIVHSWPDMLPSNRKVFVESHEPAATPWCAYTVTRYSSLYHEIALWFPILLLSLPRYAASTTSIAYMKWHESKHETQIVASPKSRSSICPRSGISKLDVSQYVDYWQSSWACFLRWPNSCVSCIASCLHFSPVAIHRCWSLIHLSLRLG